MARAKITLTVTYEYEINQEHYAPGSSIPDCLKADLANAADDPECFLDMADKVTVTGEIIEKE
jgi:hypothetical protein